VQAEKEPRNARRSHPNFLQADAMEKGNPSYSELRFNTMLFESVKKMRIFLIFAYGVFVATDTHGVVFASSKRRENPSNGLNAAPEWQAGSIGWRSMKLVEACPLEGLVRTQYAALSSAITFR
jgi:hypothetical protein